MLTQKSYQLVYQAKQTTIALEVPAPPSSTHPHRLFPSRPRKIQQPNPLKKVQLLKMIEDSDLFEPQSTPEKNSSAPKKGQERKGKISSYLAYKKEQQNLRMQQAAKVKHLRSRYLQQLSSSLKIREQIKSASIPGKNGKKQSMSKVNLTLEGEANLLLQSQTPRSRQLYLKTAEGRRERMSPSDYQMRIFSRLGKSEEKSCNDSLMVRLSDYSESGLLFPLKQAAPNSPRATNKLRIKHRKQNSNSYLGAREDNLGECRPWTSTQSQYEA